MSGGFPHSETHGSKPIPGSPWLNAGYHVLHRLLLPRHPPNALFALDLIQKEQGRWFKANLPSPGVKSCILSRATVPERTGAVSVLDLEQYRPSQSNPRMQHRSDPMIPYSGPSSDTDVSLSKRCQFVRLDGKTQRIALYGQTRSRQQPVGGSRRT
jgi:hypothetical protein